MKRIRIISILLAIVAILPLSLTGCNLFGDDVLTFDSTPELIEYVRERTVTITTDKGKGTGFFIDDKGTIVTCYHVIDGASKIQVDIANSGTVDVNTVVDFSELYDLAVIKIDREDTPYLEFFKGELLDGMDVYAIGSPVVDDAITTSGIVSKAQHKEGDVDCIVTDAIVSPGNSGGPLVNENGQVVGVNAMLYQNARLSIAVNIDNLDALDMDKNWKMSEYKEWYAKEVQRSYRIYSYSSGEYEPSTIYTYQEVTKSECIFSTNDLDGYWDFEKYKEDYEYYGYEYNSAEFDNYTRYLVNKGFELDDSADVNDANGYSYYNEFRGIGVMIYIFDNETLVINIWSN